MTIPADKALTVGKLVHGGTEDEWGVCTYSDGRVAVVRATDDDWIEYDPTTASECWAMVLYLMRWWVRSPKTGGPIIQRLIAVFVALQEDDPAAALIDLVLAVAGDK